MLGQIFTKAQNKIQDPAKLYRLIDMVDDADWVIMGADIKGDIYEGLLEKNAEDTKSGAGQYFTPRALIRAMVECLRPEPVKNNRRPACGTAYDFITNNHQLDKAQKAFLKHDTFHGNEIVANTRPLPDEHVPAQHRRDRRRGDDFSQSTLSLRPARKVLTTSLPIHPLAGKAA